MFPIVNIKKENNFKNQKYKNKIQIVKFQIFKAKRINIRKPSSDLIILKTSMLYRFYKIRIESFRSLTSLKLHIWHFLVV